MSKPRLISFKTCPFVQRSVILLKEKGVEYDIEFIDVYDPPAWFTALSPTGKVPILQIDDTVLFESGVINEYLDEVYQPSLHPSALLEKAKNRAWMEFTSSLYNATFNIMMAKSSVDLDAVVQGLDKNLASLESVMQSHPWFNGQDFSLMDIAVAPFFTRTLFYKEYCKLDLLSCCPKLQQWAIEVMSRQSVVESRVDGFEDIMRSRMRTNESHLRPV